MNAKNATTFKSQNEVKSLLTLEGGSSGVVFLSGNRIGRFETLQGPGGKAVMSADLAKEFGGKVSGGKKETLLSAIAKQIFQIKKQSEVGYVE